MSDEQQQQKPTVHFRHMGYPIFEGGHPLVHALDHPRLGDMPVRVSTVQSVEHNAEGIVYKFETLNTVYQLAEGVDDYGT